MSTFTRRHFVVCLAVLAAVGFAPPVIPHAEAFGLGGGTTADVKSTKAIRDLYDAFTKAWNAHDVKTMAARWAIDGDHVEPDGTVAKGRDQVEELLAAQHNGVFKNSKLELTVTAVWMISDTVGLVDATYKLSGAVLPDGTAIAPREGLLTSVLLLEKNTWSIAASRLMIPSKLPYKPGTEPAAAPKP